jgi:hypothetical protein
VSVRNICFQLVFKVCNCLENPHVDWLKNVNTFSRKMNNSVLSMWLTKKPNRQIIYPSKYRFSLLLLFIRHNKSLLFLFRPTRKRGMRSTVELRLTCQGEVQGFSTSQPTPPPSYESAIRDKRGFSFSNIIPHKH